MPTEKQKGYRNKWDAANMTVVGCKIRKDKAEAFKAACKAAGTTPNAVFTAAIQEFMKDKESAEE
ncbi:hypothetical protein D7X33_20900 [Butyricicoccus sp. 1XD8-22]|nr:hypothetical protein D7X33_20900 [Butyricicoccus sp. 1XD8-22]